MPVTQVSQKLTDTLKEKSCFSMVVPFVSVYIFLGEMFLEIFQSYTMYNVSCVDFVVVIFIMNKKLWIVDMFFIGVHPYVYDHLKFFYSI